MEMMSMDELIEGKQMYNQRNQQNRVFSFLFLLREGDCFAPKPEKEAKNSG
jgi:hypothetical protein